MSCCNNKPYVLVFGASVVDIFGFSCCNYRSYNSNPGKILSLIHI